jgi:ABC-type multidrug transport system fused ATPase/permease subunit
MFFNSSIIKHIWKTHKSKIGLTYLLNIIENVSWMLIPAASGLLVDGFISNTYSGIFWFVLTYVLWYGTAMVRRIVDTKVFTIVYNNVTVQTILHHRDQGINTGKVNARIELLKQMVQFFESDLSFLINNLVQLFAAATLLYFYDPNVMVVCFVVIIPSFIINYFFMKRMQTVSSQVNDQYEKQLEMIETHADKNQLISYFDGIRSLAIKKSNLEASNFGILEIFVLIMIIASLYLICQNPTLKYGDIVAIYGYVTRFAYSFDFIPHLSSRLSVIKDIDNRLKDVVFMES